MIGAGRKFCKAFKNNHLLLKLFKSYYLPKIEFGTVVWRDTSVAQRQEFDRTVNSIMKVVFPQSNISKREKLKKFAMNNLALRHEKSIILSTVSILKNKTTPFYYDLMDHWRKTTKYGKVNRRFEYTKTRTLHPFSKAWR